MTALLIIIFVAGYTAIALEHFIRVDKAATALVTGVLCWCVLLVSGHEKAPLLTELGEHLSEVSEILFFLLGAMTIVELIDAHNGFDIITSNITATNKRKLLWLISIFTFFLGPVLDNLTTAIVMVSLTRKLVTDQTQRLYFAGMIVIASNAGGAWSPIGDVTTTMLWIGGQITAMNIILKLFIPSLVCMIVPLILLSLRVSGPVERPPLPAGATTVALPRSIQLLVLISGISVLLLIPVFKMTTGLPPFMGMLLGLGILWIITETIHGKRDEEANRLSVAHALRKADSPSILFFLGILLAVAALQSAGLLTDLATWMDKRFANQNLIVIALGLLSSIVDNVPLVAASQGMYSLDLYPTDHYIWEFLAYATGTGGSALIIGSAAGVAVMGMESLSFGWYLRKISLLALIGFFAGAAVYILQHMLFS